MEHSLPHFGFGLWVVWRNVEALGVPQPQKTCLMSG